MKASSRHFVAAIALVQASGLFSLVFSELPPGYTGTPFHDDSVTSYPQKIPGKIESELFDFGGEGVGYHDDPGNSGADLNGPAQQNCPDNPGARICQFRSNENVDISYTKTCCDQSEYNVTPQILRQLYIGWTNPGEWLNYTVHVDTMGTYAVNVMYTSQQGGTVALAVNNETAGENIAITSTYDPEEPISWRQWHHWNKLNNVAKVDLDTGQQLITFKILTNGNMNFDYVEFIKEQGTRIENTSKRAEVSAIGLSVPPIIRNEAMQLTFTLPTSGMTSIALFDCKGKMIRKIAEEVFSAGSHTRLVSLPHVGQGVYFLHLAQGGNSVLRKLRH